MLAKIYIMIDNYKLFNANITFIKIILAII